MNGIERNWMHGGPDEDLPFHCRVYRKSELARLYFPESDTKTALQGLARWIKRCTELGEALEAVGYEKNGGFTGNRRWN